jgi:hypothetical protein
MINLAQVIGVNNAVETIDVGDELVVFDNRNDSMYILEGIAIDIWRILQAEPVCIEHIITRIHKSYDVSEQIIVEDFINFINSLEENGLINIFNTGASA